jgi:carbon storage regulator
MLVLTRKLMEKLFIGDDICVTVVRLEGGQVRLGIEAPRNIAVVRAELVPDRQFGARRNPGPNPPGGPGSVAVARPAGEPLRTPQASAHGTDNQRRGPSR